MGVAAARPVGRVGKPCSGGQGGPTAVLRARMAAAWPRLSTLSTAHVRARWSQQGGATHRPAGEAKVKKIAARPVGRVGKPCSGGQGGPHGRPPSAHGSGGAALVHAVHSACPRPVEPARRCHTRPATSIGWGRAQVRLLRRTPAPGTSAGSMRPCRRQPCRSSQVRGAPTGGSSAGGGRTRRPLQPSKYGPEE